MNCSNKVQATVNNAQETAIANKIIDMKQDLLLKNDENIALMELGADSKC